jgi:hypothetical protein
MVERARLLYKVQAVPVTCHTRERETNREIQPELQLRRK